MRWLVALVLVVGLALGTAVAFAGGGEQEPVPTTGGPKLGPATVVEPDGSCLTLMPPASVPEAC